jgi:hypothetical protein
VLKGLQVLKALRASKVFLALQVHKGLKVIQVPLDPKEPKVLLVLKALRASKVFLAQLAQ